MTREEAIKIIESNCSCSGSKLREACAMFIPELAESEDEKIVKAILIYLDWLDGRKDCQPKGDYTIRDMIAYIERQKECLDGNSKTSASDDERIRIALCDIVRDMPYMETELRAHGLTVEKAIAYLEKQKQSFKQISDSVIWDSGLRTGIELGKEEQKSEQYDIDVLEKHITKDSVSELAHTVIVRNGWEIVEKEQKPVPIKMDDKRMLERIMELVYFCNDKEKIWNWLCEKVKETAEWDELQAEFRSINEAFEDGKKEVIEHPERYGLQKPAEWNKATINGKPIPTENHSVDIPLAEWSEDIIRKAVKEIGLTQHQIDWFKDNVFPSKVEWNEEDEGELQNAIDALEFLGKKGVYKSESGYDAALQAASWLKNLSLSLKKRNEDVTKLCSNEWSEEDKNKLYRVIETLLGDKEAARHETPQHYDVLCKAYDELIDFLKSLPERFVLQPKQEWSDDIIRKAVKEVGLTQHQIDWFKTNVFPPKQELSEEGEKIINEFCDIIASNAKDGYLGRYYAPDLIEKLKSIRLQQKDNKCISPKEGDIVVNKYGEISIFENWGHHPDGGSFNDDSYFFAKCTLNGDDYYDDFDCYSESDGLRYATPEEIRKIVPYLLKSRCPQSHCEPTEKQKYDGNMDEECIKLCDVLNSIPSIDTFESCCGHLKDRYSIWFFCNDIITISRLGRCVERNYSDGKWEIFVDSTDTHPTGVFWLRSKVPFQSYDEMEKSVNELCNGIQHWFNTEFDSYFNNDLQNNFKQ